MHAYTHILLISVSLQKPNILANTPSKTCHSTHTSASKCPVESPAFHLHQAVRGTPPPSVDGVRKDQVGSWAVTSFPSPSPPCGNSGNHAGSLDSQLPGSNEAPVLLHAEVVSERA